VSREDVLLITLIVLGPAVILWGIYLMRTRRQRKPAAILGIPHTMRPGAPDERLEGPRLERIMWGGFLASFFLIIFVVGYWLPERERQEHFVSRFEEESLHRGELIYNAPPQLEEDISAAAFKELEKELSLGQACSNCHGGVAKDSETGEIIKENSATGGVGNPLFKDPATGQIIAYQAPPLNTVFSRWDPEVVRFTIERGRPGTDMPTWGVEFGGSMTTLMVDDVMAFLESIQVPLDDVSEECKNPDKSAYMQCGQEIFTARCAVCHGPEGQGKEDMRKVSDDPDIDDQELLGAPEGGNSKEDDYPEWWQGMALWKGDVRHLSKNLHYYTIYNGRRFAFMPPFGEAPAQGIPIPPNPLTDKQIRAVMTYERSL
jgi:cytochrome c553